MFLVSLLLFGIDAIRNLYFDRQEIYLGLLENPSEKLIEMEDR